MLSWWQSLIITNIKLLPPVPTRTHGGLIAHRAFLLPQRSRPSLPARPWRREPGPLRRRHETKRAVLIDIDHDLLADLQQQIGLPIAVHVFQREQRRDIWPVGADEVWPRQRPQLLDV